ncbi:hypothetical protein BDV98DRAFT_555372 [Pterulicium gracile]|uniref:Uncharacterized protein n=1 Tax=Pterulicium gracile TaxID=1884261 RepID=A0A5C3Q886_9AGAR|nr:hypothetical protein BDV98DRAFT_555372 [Pterula gracilis]
MMKQSLLSLVACSVALSSSSSLAPALSLWNGTQLVNAVALVEDSSSFIAPDPLPAALPDAAVTWDCKGSTLCWSLAPRDCDTAARLSDVNAIYTTKGVAPNVGVCFGHCGIFVQRPACTVDGQALKNGYDGIRDFGCKRCGSEHQDDGCLVTVNYVTGC